MVSYETLISVAFIAFVIGMVIGAIVMSNNNEAKENKA
jgi:uncharacterized membrane-anchored protein YhcB (DUF1043 family)